VHVARRPAHVTLRAALAAASGPAFRVRHWSVQADHLHLVVEADAPGAFVRGCQGLAIRVAKAVNRALRRAGAVWGDRYHARGLTTPRALHCLIYVLQNWRKHVPGARGLDPRSAAAWFSGWRSPAHAPSGPPPAARPRTWRARVGWLRRGRIAVDEAPHGAPRVVRR
jgi:hypothetical protein